MDVKVTTKDSSPISRGWCPGICDFKNLHAWFYLLDLRSYGQGSWLTFWGWTYCHLSQVTILLSQKEKAWQLGRTKNTLEKQTGHPQALLHQGGQTEQLVGAGEERVHLASALTASSQEGKNTLAWDPWRVKWHHAAWPWSRTSLYSHNSINVFVL